MRLHRLVPLLLCFGCKGNETKPVVIEAKQVFDATVAQSEQSMLPERVVVTRVAISQVDPKHPREIYPERLARSLGQLLGESDWFTADPAPVPVGFRPRRAAVELIINYDLVEADSVSSMIATAEAQVVWEDNGDGLSLQENVRVQGVVAKEGLKHADELMAEHVSRTVEVVGKGLMEKEAIRSGPPTFALAALASDDVDLVLWALYVVRDRRMMEALEFLPDKLDSSDLDVREAAVGAMLALDDARLVDRLTNKAEFGDHQFMRIVIDAVGTRKTESAREYLEFVATGHPDSDIKKQAAAALQRSVAGSRR